MRRAGDMLVRALMDRGPCRVLAADEQPWRSVTFVGAQHAVRLAIPAEAVGTFVAGIADAEFDLGEHLPADIVVAENFVLGFEHVVTIEALTIERADVFPPQSRRQTGRSEAKRMTTCGTKRAFVPLAAA